MTPTRKHVLAAAFVFVAVACAACPPPDDVPNDAGVVVDAGPTPLQYLAVLDDAADLDLVKGEQNDAKFLAQVDGVDVEAPILDPCEFQNTALYPFHVPFLNAQPGGEDVTFDAYVDKVIRRANRVWWGGEVVFLPQAPHPITGEPGVLAWTLYTEDSNGNRLELDDVRAGFARLVPCTPAFAGQLAFTPASNEQTTTATNGEAELAAEGIAVLLP